jgi:D-glycerate 3-kinase
LKHDKTDTRLLADFAARHQLPTSYVGTAERWFVPLADQLASAVSAGELRVLGIVGSQGSGKSTLAGLLEVLLTEVHGLGVVSLSLDDFYLTRAEREKLADEVHPLLATRGVPGTHDVELAIETIRQLLLSHKGEVRVPRFDKARDDRRPKDQWDAVDSPADLVILDGWCLGVKAEHPASLAEPVNRLEREEDPEGRWRAYVNYCLKERYPPLFALMDRLILLKAPSFDCVYKWRLQQESKLSRHKGDRVMSEAQLRRFVEHFERITRHCLSTLPARADLIFELNEQQAITRCHENSAHG